MENEKINQIWDESVDSDAILELIEECENILADTEESDDNAI